MKAKVPTSKATNAYDLLSDVIRIIREEPRRYNQMRFIARTNGAYGADNVVHGGSGFPACGTVGCVAGWVATLVRGSHFRYNRAQPIAATVLGLRGDQAWKLFSGGAADGAPQTAEHAKSGIRHIRRFQKKYSTQLKATKVTR